MDICFFIKRFLFIPILSVSFLIIESEIAFANTLVHSGPDCENTKNQWLVGVGGGGVNRDLFSSTQVSNGTLVPAPYNHDIFSIHTRNDEGTMTLFAGHQWDRSSLFIPYYNVTLHYEHQFETNITGKIEQYALPEFTNYNYSMGLKSDIFSLIGNVGLIKYKCLLPYFSAGVGRTINHVSDYSESPIPPVNPARISPHYGSNTNTNFAYSLGAGVNIIFCKNIWASLAYEYWNLGKVNSAPGRGPWSGTRLDFGTLETNTLLATITYFF